MRSRLAKVVSCSVFLAGSIGVARADDPSFKIDFKDGAVAPTRLEVPASTRFVLVLTNSGTTPAEFESVELHKEKVLAPGVTSTLVFRSLDPGEYDFFDDFHPGRPTAVLVAK